MSWEASCSAADALCCRRLGRRSRAQDHAHAAHLLASIDPHGMDLARQLTAALAIKYAAHYGTALLTIARTKAALRAATKLVEAAEEAAPLRDIPGV